MRRGQLGMRSEGRRGNYSFQRPQILMRLKMLTRDKMSLLRAASLRTAWETACGLNDRKKRGWVEAGILPTELLPLNWHLKYSKINRLRERPKSPSLRIPDSTVSRTWHSIKNDLRHADELAQNENGQYATSAHRAPETALGPLDQIATIVPWASDSGAQEGIPHPRT